MKNNILRDLKLGEIAENQIIDLFITMGYPSCKNIDNNQKSYYDIMSEHPTKKFTTEVKHDIYSNKSGNIAIETFNPKTGKNSGLNITRADLWIHITDKPYITSVKKLKKYVDENKPHRIISCGGDNNATLYLYRADIILNAIFKPLSLNISISNGQKIITTFLGV